LLIYRLDGSTLIFVRTGAHSELFEECPMPLAVVVLEAKRESEDATC
jgi:hypothetical protein